MEQKWAADIAEKIKKKERAVVERNRHNVPYLSKDGRFDDWSDRIGWWTNGFWGGMMWQLYHATKDPVYKETAEERCADGLPQHGSRQWIPLAADSGSRLSPDGSRNVEKPRYAGGFQSGRSL